MSLKAMIAACAFALAATTAHAGYVFKGNDTGGIIAWPLAQRIDARRLAVDHCASYGKLAKRLATQPYYGGYISFACVWVPYGRMERPLRVAY